MGSYRMAKIRNVKTGNIYSTSLVSFDMLEAMKRGDIEFLEIETHFVPEYPTMIEIELLKMHDEGEEIPKQLQPFLKKAQKKRDDIAKDAEFKKTLTSHKNIIEGTKGEVR